MVLHSRFWCMRSNLLYTQHLGRFHWKSFSHDIAWYNLSDRKYSLPSCYFMRKQSNLTTCSGSFFSKIVSQNSNLIEILILRRFRASKEFATKSSEEYLKDIEIIGRIYDYETENEHQMTAFQQFIDKTINDTSVYNFTSIVKLVRIFFYPNWLMKNWI